MPKPKSKQKDIREFLGKGGYGKSTLMRKQLANVIPSRRGRVIFFDTNAEDENAQGAVLCHTKAELVAAVKETGKFNVCWRGHLTMPHVEAFEFANRVAKAAHNCVVVWEEADRYMKAMSVPPIAMELIDAGRHWGVTVFAASRRPQRMPRDLTANASRIMCFHSSDSTVINYLKEFIGEEWAEKLPTLQRYEAISHYEDPDQKTAIKKSPFT